MALLVHRSIGKKVFIVVASILSVPALAPTFLAQRGTVHTGGGMAHVSSPPTPHVANSPAPTLRAPISIPRIPIAWSANGALGTAGFRPPRRPIRPFPPVVVIDPFPLLFGEPFWGLNSCWWATCDLFWSWTPSYATIFSPGPMNDGSPVYETPADVYGEQRPDLPQLLLKDGRILNVTDYWLVDGQLHFTMIEEDGGKAAEHVIPFDALNLQTTVDLNAQRGFRFMLRNEPFEQYLRDHPEGPPPVIAPSPD